MTYAGGLTVAYQWDVANNLERLTWPDHFVVDYAWDANNRVTQTLDGARVLADVSYDGLSRRQTVAYGNGTTVNHTWSNRGDLTGHDHSFTGASVDYDFTYNGVGQMLTKTLSNPAYGWVAPTIGTETYLVNGLNQYTSIDGAAPMYDGNGNLTTDHQGRNFSYDAENVLRTASGLAGGTATYRYHADGSRRQKSHNGSTSHFYYMGGLGYLDAGDTAFAADQEIAAYSGAGVLQKRFVRLPGSIDEAFLMIDVSSGSPIETWAHMDRLGSVIATTDSTGVTNGTYQYSPYGRPGSEGASGFPFRFTGQRLDAETGLYYYKARYYDPETGRFLQTDPIGYDDNMNLYAYVGNDPVNGIDPTGLSCTGTHLNNSRFCAGTGGDTLGSAKTIARSQAEANSSNKSMEDNAIVSQSDSDDGVDAQESSTRSEAENDTDDVRLTLVERISLTLGHNAISDWRDWCVLEYCPALMESQLSELDRQFNTDVIQGGKTANMSVAEWAQSNIFLYNRWLTIVNSQSCPRDCNETAARVHEEHVKRVYENARNRR